MRRLSAVATLTLALALPGGALAESLSKPLRSAVAAPAGGSVVLENLAGSLEVVAAAGREAVAFAMKYKLFCWGMFTYAGNDDAYVVPGPYGEL